MIDLDLIDSSTWEQELSLLLGDNKKKDLQMGLFNLEVPDSVYHFNMKMLEYKESLGFFNDFQKAYNFIRLLPDNIVFSEILGHINAYRADTIGKLEFGDYRGNKFELVGEANVKAYKNAHLARLTMTIAPEKLNEDNFLEIEDDLKRVKGLSFNFLNRHRPDKGYVKPNFATHVSVYFKGSIFDMQSMLLDYISRSFTTFKDLSVESLRAEDHVHKW